MLNNEKIAGKDVHEVLTRWNSGMHFTSRVNNHDIELDKLPQHGGNDTGPRPKPLILSAAAGCVGMELISILEKMRVTVSNLELNVSGELNEGQPKMYKTVSVQIKVNCRENDKEKVSKAIHLATEKYCGVLAMIRHFATVDVETIFL
jgi:putative redox protein